MLRRVGGTDLAIATRQLATLIGAGIPLVEALGALTEQVEGTRLKSAISQVRDRVNEGASLADALSQTAIFGDLYVSMVRAGETGGALEQVLERLADYLESQVRTRNKVVSIMIYPAIMFAVAIGVVIALVTVVLPQITQLLDSLNQPLPFYTLAIIGLSNLLREYWWALLLVVAVARASPSGPRFAPSGAAHPSTASSFGCRSSERSSGSSPWPGSRGPSPPSSPGGSRS